MQRSLILVILLVFLLPLLFLKSPEFIEGGNDPATLIKLRSSIGVKDDPHARARFELNKLRDPVTRQVPPNIRAKELAFARSLPDREALGTAQPDQSGRRAKAAVLDWSPRGPFNVGGRTRALALDITNENIILAGGVSGGLWRSIDGGASWTNTTNPSDLHSVTSIAQDTRPGEMNIWYYSTGEFRGGSAAGGDAGFVGDGIFKSTDGGNSWAQLAATVSASPESFNRAFEFIWKVVINPANTAADEVYAATFGGIQRSTDGGVSWSRMLGSFSGGASSFCDIAVTTSGILYAVLSEGTLSGAGSLEQGIYRSTNGTAWTDITPPSWPAVYNRIVIGIAPSNENVVYFLGETPGFGFQADDEDEWTSLWKYDNGSGNWTDRSANLPALGAPVGDFISQGSYDLLVSVKPNDENVVFIGGTNLYRSTNGFATATSTTWVGGYARVNDISQYDNHHADQHKLVFLPSNPNIMISSHDGGLSRANFNSADSIGWTLLNNGYITSQFYAIALDHGTPGNNILVGGLQDNGTWFTNKSSFKSSWIRIFSGDGGFAAIANGRSAYYVSAQNGQIFRQDVSDTGQLLQWTQVTPAGASGFLFIAPFLLDPNDSRIMYLAAGDRIWRNSNLTAIPFFLHDPTSVNWSQLSNAAVGQGSVTALAASTNPANRLYYGTDDGQVYRIEGANNGNPNPVDIWTGKGLPDDAYVSSIAIDPTDADKALLVFSSYRVRSLYYTADAGATWTNVSGNLEENSDGSGSGPSTRWASILPFGGAIHFFVAASTGLYSTANLNGNATIWAQEGASSIGNVVVDMVVTRVVDGVVVAATHGQGAYSSKVNVTSVEGDSPLSPVSYALHPNFPNPFNPATLITYSIQRSHGRGAIKLEIINSVGQRVRTLVNVEQPAGAYQVEWDGKDDLGDFVASGVYVYRLTSGSFVESRKMVLVR